MLMKKNRTPVVILLAVLLVLAGCSKKEAEQPAASQTPQMQQAPAPPAAPAPAAPAAKRAARPASSAAAPARAAVIVPAETEFTVRTITSLNSGENKDGDTWEGTLESPVVVDSKEVIPKGASVTGTVVRAVPSGRLGGRAELALALTSVTVHGRRYTITTSELAQQEGSKATRDILMIGGGAGAGAAIGAIAGGGKGAAIGSAIGAIAGTGGAAATGKRDIKFPSESVLRFRLRQNLRL
jgi:glucose/arabinose dehydrogenase